MVSLNRVLLIGNLTKDPELRYTPSGTPVANLRLAVNSSFKDQSGQRKEETCFVTIVVWARQAETCNQYLKKGRSIFVEGYIYLVECFWGNRPVSGRNPGSLYFCRCFSQYQHFPFQNARLPSSGPDHHSTIHSGNCNVFCDFFRLRESGY